MNSTEQRELVLKIFKDDQYEELREIIKTECFEDIFNYINEHNIDLTPFLDQLPDEWNLNKPFYLYFPSYFSTVNC